MDNVVKWGILGTSFISEVIADAIQASNQAQLVGVASRTQEKSDAFAKKFSLYKSYAQYEAMLNDPDIDVIYIGLPNHMHKEWTIRCAEAGKHILCDKPFALNPQEVSDAFLAVQKAGVHCIEGLMYRYHPFISKLQSLINQNVIGDIKLIHAMYAANIAHLANPIAGGAIRNLGCYPVSLIRLLMGKEPVDIRGAGRMDAANQNDHQGSALLTFDNEVTAVVSTVDDIEKYYQFDMYGTEGVLKVISNPWMPDQTTNKVAIHYNNGQIEEIVVSADKPLYTYQIDELSSRIRHSPFSPVLHEASRQDSLANIAVLDKWLNDVYAMSNNKHSADLLQVS